MDGTFVILKRISVKNLVKVLSNASRSFAISIEFLGFIVNENIFTKIILMGMGRCVCDDSSMCARGEECNPVTMTCEPGCFTDTDQLT